jgi:hypothetical protein
VAGKRFDSGQIPVTEASSRYASCAALHELLTEGWRIEAPVYARPRWQSLSDSRDGKTYHFVLWRDNQVNLVSIVDSPEIQEFLVEYGLAVDCL